MAFSSIQNGAGGVPPSIVRYAQDRAAQAVVQIDTNGNPIEALSGISSTGTASSVASNAADVSILAANANRRGAIIFNDDANVLRLLLAAGTSSATNYTVQVPTNTGFQVPFGYTGVIKGIWSAAGAGAARVTEFT